MYLSHPPIPLGMVIKPDLGSTGLILNDEAPAILAAHYNNLNIECNFFFNF